MVQTGTATWYGKGFHGHTTASGEVYNMNALTAAHVSLPMNTLVRVTYPRTGRSIVVRINDRLPAFVDCVIDLSAKAAEFLGLKRRGAGTVRLAYLAKGEAKGAAPRLAARQPRRLVMLALKK
ncbi:MAG: septal ring lytic transglycosylase RlpA family protein [Alphaproteobacteria bacterium]